MLHTKDYTSKLLDMEHIEITKVETSAQESGVYFQMDRRQSIDKCHVLKRKHGICRRKGKGKRERNALAMRFMF